MRSHRTGTKSRFRDDDAKSRTASSLALTSAHSPTVTHLVYLCGQNQSQDEGDRVTKRSQSHVCLPLSYASQLTSIDGVSSKKLQFSTLTAQDVVKISEFQVTHRDLYTTTDRAPVKDGVLDRRLVSLYPSLSISLIYCIPQGTSEKNTFCETCGLNAVDCVGHYAYIKLVVPVFHIGYFKHTIAILQCICKVWCSPS
jgi:RNA polymerase Rpb1, domain 1